jgi:hypothetical protein
MLEADPAMADHGRETLERQTTSIEDLQQLDPPDVRFGESTTGIGAQEAKLREARHVHRVDTGPLGDRLPVKLAHLASVVSGQSVRSGHPAVRRSGKVRAC